MTPENKKERGVIFREGVSTKERGVVGKGILTKERGVLGKGY